MASCGSLRRVFPSPTLEFESRACYIQSTCSLPLSYRGWPFWHYSPIRKVSHWRSKSPDLRREVQCLWAAPMKIFKTFQIGSLDQNEAVEWIVLLGPAGEWYRTHCKQKASSSRNPGLLSFQRIHIDSTKTPHGPDHHRKVRLGGVFELTHQLIWLCPRLLGGQPGWFDVQL